MVSFRCAAILFDLDGVLVDSTHSVSRQWRRWAGENRLDSGKVVGFAHGVRTIEVIRAFAPGLDAAEEAVKIEQREAEDRDGVTVMPGAGELLHAIPPGRWCVVTSGTRRLAEARLRLGNLPVPKVLVTAEDVTNGKPDPEPYLLGAQRLQAEPARCVVIEDAPAGVQAGKSAGMKVIGFASTYPSEQLAGADIVLKSLREIEVGVLGDELNLSVRKS